MTKPTIEELLFRSAPSSIADDPSVRTQVDTVIARSRSRARSRRPRKKVLILALPLLFAPVAALGLSGSVEERMAPDYVMPIVYTTDTGRSMQCSIEFFNEEVLWIETNTAAEDYLRTQDWTGIGQRIYDLALDRLAANDPATNQPNEWPAGVINQPTSAQRDQQAWVLAENRLITDHIVAGTDANVGFGSQTDCTPAELH